ncbi:hypothetical protein XPA_010133 [Xanthoria parietina]
MGCLTQLYSPVLVCSSTQIEFHAFPHQSLRSFIVDPLTNAFPSSQSLCVFDSFSTCCLVCCGIPKMAPRTRVIIDTDPGNDDVLALLYALASSPEDIEVLLISIAFGNVNVQNCLRNAVSMFHVIEKEMRWRKEHGRPEGFEALKKSKPVIAVGADEPLGGKRVQAAYYHGADGLGGVHTSHPHHTSPSETWQHLFDRPPPDTVPSSTATTTTTTKPASTSPTSPLFTPSSSPAHLEILNILDREPPQTITLIAIGPLTTFATAAAHAPTTFLKAKSLLVMGGAIAVPGNMTPVAEFNALADPIAAARIYALTSPAPQSTMPPFNPATTSLTDYPPPAHLGAQRLRVVKFPLDITTPHSLRRDEVLATVEPLRALGSPLAEWVMAFTEQGFRTTEALNVGFEDGGGDTWVSLHDPVVLWFAVATGGEGRMMEGWEVVRGEDVRVETVGQWTRGMCVVDGRDRKKRVEGEGGRGRGRGRWRGIWGIG